MAAIILETLRDRKYLSVMHRDLHGSVAHDKELCQMLHTAGETIGYFNVCCISLMINSVPLVKASIFAGASDAAAFTQAGLRACCLAAMDPSPATYYHTIRDSWNNMDTDTLSTAIAVLDQFIRVYDDRPTAPQTTIGINPV